LNELLFSEPEVKEIKPDWSLFLLNGSLRSVFLGEAWRGRPIYDRDVLRLLSGSIDLIRSRVRSGVSNFVCYIPPLLVPASKAYSLEDLVEAQDDIVGAVEKICFLIKSHLEQELGVSVVFQENPLIIYDEENESEKTSGWVPIKDDSARVMKFRYKFVGLGESYAREFRRAKGMAGEHIYCNPKIGMVSLAENLKELENLAQCLYEFSLPQILDFIRQSAEGLAILHDRGLVYGDYKIDNILILNNEEAALFDFEGVVRPGNGQRIWGSPEYFEGDYYDFGSEVDQGLDLFSLGMTLFEVYCLLNDLEDEDDEDGLMAVFYREFEEKCEQGGGGAGELLQTIKGYFEKIQENRRIFRLERFIFALCQPKRGLRPSVREARDELVGIVESL